jgi:hypothetical protein
MMAEPAGGYDAVMDRTEPVSRFMRRMEALDLRLRRAELAELASACFARSAPAEPERLAEKAGNDGARRAD